MNIDGNPLPPNDEDGSPEDALQGVLFEASPWGNVNAIVQHDGRAVYFYLSGDETFGTRACWIRNLVEAPYVISQADLESGVPPLMPRTHCSSPTGQPLPDPQSLEIVWFEEGNGAALFQEDQLIAVIPPWSGVDGFHGYSRECTAESPIAWPMIGNPMLLKRIDRAREFWQTCASEADHPFKILQPQLLELYRSCFDGREEYFTLDAGQFPPRGAALYRRNDSMILISVGMSLRAMPNVELSVEHPQELRRIELAIKLPPDVEDDLLQAVLAQFSGLVSWPWIGYTWFGTGHTCEMTSLQGIFGSNAGSVTMTGHEKIKPTFGLRMPAFRDDSIQLLWLSPSSENEETDN